MTMISVVELTKHFWVGQTKIVAVDHLSFRVAAGEVYGLLGPNGAGKTTTLWMVLGVLKPTSGYAEVGGYRSTDVPDAVKARLGLLSASAGVYPWLTPRETLLFFADLYHVPPDRAVEAVDRISGKLGLSRFLDQRCATLSTGQKQRVNLARALIHDPQIMLLDEPTRGLDVWGSKVIFDYVRHLRDVGKAVIVCTHRLDEAQRLCDRFGLLHDGRLLHEGTLTELRQRTGCESLTEMFLQFIETTADGKVETR
jgi:sodium transport system ATP-binding protein